MRKWEDIVKDKLEEPEGELPESVFAEFRSRREASAAAPAPKRFRLAWAAFPAMAAGIAAYLLLQGPVATEGDIRIIRQPSDSVATVTDSASETEPGLPAPLISRSVMPKAAGQPVVMPQNLGGVENVGQTKDNTVANEDVYNVEPDVSRPDAPESKDEKADDNPVAATTSPFIPNSTETKHVTLKVGTAAGIIAGGGLLAGLITPVLGTSNNTYINTGHDGPPIYAEAGNPQDTPIHYLPIKAGLSAKVPLSDRWFIATGLEYSMYQSILSSPLYGSARQTAHYLGVPVRLNWVLASGKLIDVYAGGGFEGDVCLGANLAGNNIVRDGFSLSLQGAGGIQMNFAKRLGFYVEPQLSWRVPFETAVLNTYRSENPLMFCVAAGLRFNFGKQ